jgi:hypothetical protein
MFSYVLSKQLFMNRLLLTNWICSIINLMKYWVTMPHFKVDTNVLDRAEEFASSVRGSKPMEKLAKELHSASAARVLLQLFQ